MSLPQVVSHLVFLSSGKPINCNRISQGCSQEKEWASYLGDVLNSYEHSRWLIPPARCLGAVSQHVTTQEQWQESRCTVKLHQPLGNIKQGPQIRTLGHLGGRLGSSSTN